MTILQQHDVDDDDDGSLHFSFLVIIIIIVFLLYSLSSLSLPAKLLLQSARFFLFTSNHQIEPENTTQHHYQKNDWRLFQFDHHRIKSNRKRKNPQKKYTIIPSSSHSVLVRVKNKKNGLLRFDVCVFSGKRILPIFFF